MNELECTCDEIIAINVCGSYGLLGKSKLKKNKKKKKSGET